MTKNYEKKFIIREFAIAVLLSYEILQILLNFTLCTFYLHCSTTKRMNNGNFAYCLRILTKIWDNFSENLSSFDANKQNEQTQKPLDGNRVTHSFYTLFTLYFIIYLVFATFAFNSKV